MFCLTWLEKNVKLKELHALVSEIHVHIELIEIHRHFTSKQCQNCAFGFFKVNESLSICGVHLMKMQLQIEY